MFTLFDRIVSAMHRDYQLQKSLRLRQEAARLAEQSRKQDAERVCRQSRDEWDAAYRSIATSYEEKRQFNAQRPKLKRLTRRKF